MVYICKNLVPRLIAQTSANKIHYLFSTVSKTTLYFAHHFRNYTTDVIKNYEVFIHSFIILTSSVNSEPQHEGGGGGGGGGGRGYETGISISNMCRNSNSIC